jgi:hypothetical protein
LGAWRLRARLLPGWTGPPARLVEVLLALLGLMASAEILGALDALRGGPVVGTCIAVALGMAVVGRSPRRDPGPGGHRCPPQPWRRSSIASPFNFLRRHPS